MPTQQRVESAPDLTTDVVIDAAKAAGVCIRPLLRRVTDRATGQVTTVPIPCGSTRETVCPSCADRARRLRMHQCREGWHLTDDPPSPTTDDQADDELHLGLDLDDAHASDDDEDASRRARSTRRRQDAPELPRVPMDSRTTGRAFTDAKTGRTYRPSMFLTLTLGSYGKVIPGTGTPVDPARYDYRRAALDALLFPRLVDRFWQNLRRCAGYRVQYFAAVEPQKRLAPHLHAAIRGTIPRSVVRQVVKATYHQVWWPPIDRVVYDGDRLPVWDADASCYRDPHTAAPLTSWDRALDDLGADPDAKPLHVLRFGAQVDLKGLLGGTEDSDRAVRYLCKYLTKSVTETYARDHVDPEDRAVRAYEAHIDRLHMELRWLPCSPRCANWLRHGVQPMEAGPGLIPGACPSKAHDREHLGLGGRRVLVSRQWSGKTLTEHRADRATVVREVLQAAGIEPPDARRLAAEVLASDGRPRFEWADVPVLERDYTAAISASMRQRRAWREQYEAAKAAGPRAGPPTAPVDRHSATESAA
ncbi:replication initiator [uncultured Cellulomonas sp.]|uniref:replication initiator n=1 Tax=uncultured Cellulomonas sp. TaxID=189682 RepID=UPI00262FB4DB|nr:replication initiator [uncultured Cellulomonas sp.]